MIDHRVNSKLEMSGLHYQKFSLIWIFMLISKRTFINYYIYFLCCKILMFKILFSTPANEDDIEGQLILRSTRFWGRIYIGRYSISSYCICSFKNVGSDGWPQTIQFFRAHFGIEPPIGRKVKLLLSVRFIFPILYYFN